MSEGLPINHQGDALETKNFDRNAQARSQGESFGILKLKNESDDRYRERLSGILRAQGRIIEAHEVYTGRRYDDPEQGEFGPMLGIIGALSGALREIDFHTDGEHQVGDDIAIGIVELSEENPAKSAIRSMFDTIGPAAGMDIIEEMIERNR